MHSGADIIYRYFPSLTETQKGQIARLYELYAHWNAQINVISRKDIDQLYERHVLHSLAIAKFVSFKKGTKVMDVGTGGGFPGIPLAILFPETDFFLVDSIGKKIKVVNEVAAALGLKNIRTAHVRAETIKERFDFIVSRAVTDLDEFYGWVRGKIAHKSFNAIKNGILYLKGGDLEKELRNFPDAKVEALTDYFSEEFFETKKLVYLPA
ncbi:MAG: 16S rRNA (guanine(527)-N(7))-methyltransferase RsmG [Bacteroidota bacterium]